MAILITLIGLILMALCLSGAVVLGVCSAAADDQYDQAIAAKRDLDSERAAAEEAESQWRAKP